MRSSNNKGSRRKSSMKDKNSTARKRPEDSTSTRNAREKVADSKAVHNDPKWYSLNGQYLKDVASFSFKQALGKPINLYTTSDGSYTTVNIPGIYALYNVPTVGIATSALDPVNKAAQKVYSYVRHANSGHSNYDPSNLMMYLLGMDSIYTFWSWMVRAYGTAMVFSKDNWYINEALLTAMGVDPANLKQNLSQFRAYINNFAIHANTFAVPRIMSYFLRHSWMYSNIYKDENVNRAQMYMYVPAGLYKYGLNDVGGAILEYTPLVCDSSFNQRSLTVSQIMTYGDDLLTSFSTQEDIGIISGDILKAYGFDNLWNLPATAEDYGVIPTFSEEVLMQIHNTEFAGYPANVGTSAATPYAAGLNVGENAGYLSFSPFFYPAKRCTYDKILDFWVEDVTPEMSMVASRNLVVSEKDTTGQREAQGIYKITSCGSEIVLFGVVYYLNAAGSLTGQAIGKEVTISRNTAVYYLSRFNEAPLFLDLHTSSTPNIIGEIDNYARIDPENVKDMHNCALLSMFGIDSP